MPSAARLQRGQRGRQGKVFPFMDRPQALGWIRAALTTSLHLGRGLGCPGLQDANGARAHQHSGQGPVPGRTRQQQPQQDPTCTFQERSKQQNSPVALRGQLLEVLTYQEKLDVEEFLSLHIFIYIYTHTSNFLSVFFTAGLHNSSKQDFPLCKNISLSSPFPLLSTPSSVFPFSFSLLPPTPSHLIHMEGIQHAYFSPVPLPSGVLCPLSKPGLLHTPPAPQCSAWPAKVGMLGKHQAWCDPFLATLGTSPDLQAARTSTLSQN